MILRLTEFYRCIYFPGIKKPDAFIHRDQGPTKNPHFLHKKSSGKSVGTVLPAHFFNVESANKISTWPVLVSFAEECGKSHPDFP